MIQCLETALKEGILGTMKTRANAPFLESTAGHNRVILFVKWQTISLLESILLRQFASKETTGTIHPTAKENRGSKEKRVSASLQHTEPSPAA